MKRDKALLLKRRKTMALLLEIKKSRGISWKCAIIEIAEAFTVSEVTVRKELTKYNKVGFIEC
jgi:DeoR/GlpR family transcriptional regulator of sugar metabolism